MASFCIEPEPVEHLKLAPLNTRRLRHQGWVVIAHLKMLLDPEISANLGPKLELSHEISMKKHDPKIFTLCFSLVCINTALKRNK